MLTIAIKTKADADAFLSYLHKKRWVFHPDDDAFDIVFDSPTTPTPSEMTQMNQRMGEVVEVLEDPYSHILEHYSD